MEAGKIGAAILELGQALSRIDALGRAMMLPLVRRLCEDPTQAGDLAKRADAVAQLSQIGGAA